MTQFKILERENVIESPYLSLVSETVQTATGPEPFFLADRGNSVCIVALTADAEIVTVREYRHGIGASILKLPGGKIDTHESWKQACYRELREETGYTGNTVALMNWWYTGPDWRDDLVYCCIMRDVVKSDVQELDKLEYCSVETYPYDDIASRVIEGQIKDPSSMIALLMLIACEKYQIPLP